LHLLSKNYSENPPIDAESEEQEQLRLRLRKITKSIKLLVVNNPLLLSPYQDSQAIDVALAITLLSSNSELDEFVKSWLSEMINMCIFAFESNGMYPIVNNSYEQLLEHRNKNKTDRIYKNKVTEASILYPLLAVFFSLYKLDSESQILEQFAKENLSHSTLQYWYPNQYSEMSMYSDVDAHGSSTTDFPMNGKSALEHIKRECGSTDSFRGMSAVVKGKAPLILTACRRYRYPVPFHYLEDFMAASESSPSTQ
jgi:hypothetical protein